MERQFDPILDEPECESDKFVLGEIAHPEAYDLYKKQLACFWVAESIDLSEDAVHFQRLKPAEQKYILSVLGFFAASDGIVLENAVCRFYSDVQPAEYRLFYGLQIAIENIHSELYTEIIKVYEKDPEERLKLFRSIDSSNAVARKAEWAKSFMDPDLAFAERIVGFAAVEGILFSSSFAAIFYTKKRGLNLAGLVQSNAYIARDEALHTEFACLIYRKLKPCNRLSRKKVTQIVLSAVEVEEAFVREALAEPILGMSAPLMIEYVKFVSDVVLQMLGCPRHFKNANPFPWMETISMNQKVNFFERRVTEYSLADVKTGGKAKGEASSRRFSLDADF